MHPVHVGIALSQETMRFTPALLDEIRARLPVSQVVGRTVALKKAGREWKGLSPFKTERTPSFFVNDQKGFYHCFASGEHGTIFDFLMKTQGLSFPEAVERLAEEAGVPIPTAEPRDQAREDQRQRLLDLMEASAKFFEAAYRGDSAAHARRYVVETRGLSAAAIATFRLGYAPESRNALKQHLAKLGFTGEEMITSGMLIGGADIPVSYDRFRNRVMFPITDLRGRVIAFGGRALDADAPAKYLNSPETPLFHKGHVLFNAPRARAAAHKSDRLIVVEGYMDVVALASAGFPEAVAPLGTALTEEQTKLLWRFAPEPILAFDGDGAGKKAAYRAIDVALPHLEPGKSLRFAFLPDGLDPDDLVRQRGRAAMDEVLAQSRPFAEVLFEREWGGGEWTTPERRAQFERQLTALVARIENPQVRGWYADDVRERIIEAFGRSLHAGRDVARRGGTGLGDDAQRSSRSRFTPFQPGQLGRQPQRRAGAPSLLDAPLPASDSLKSAVQAAAPIPPREAVLLRTLLNHPWLLDDRWEDVAALDFGSDLAQRVRNAILAHHVSSGPLDSTTLRSQLRDSGLSDPLETIEAVVAQRGDRFSDPLADQATVEPAWRHLVALHRRHQHKRLVAEAREEYEREQTSENWQRLEAIVKSAPPPTTLDDDVAA